MLRLDFSSMGSGGRSRSRGSINSSISSSGGASDRWRPEIADNRHTSSSSLYLCISSYMSTSHQPQQPRHQQHHPMPTTQLPYHHHRSWSVSSISCIMPYTGLQRQMLRINPFVMIRDTASACLRTRHRVCIKMAACTVLRDTRYCVIVIPDVIPWCTVRQCAWYSLDVILCTRYRMW